MNCERVFENRLLSVCRAMRDKLEAVPALALPAEEIRRIWPEGSPESSHVGEWVRCYLTLRRVFVEPGAGVQPLDPYSQLLVNAALASPLAVFAAELKVFPKSYRSLQLAAQIRAAADGVMVRSQAEHEARIDWCLRRIAWIALHPEPACPFTLEVCDLPPHIEVLSIETVAAVVYAYQQLHHDACLTITGHPLCVAQSPSFVPDVCRRLSVVTEEDPEVLASHHSYAQCLALGVIASELEAVVARGS